MTVSVDLTSLIMCLITIIGAIIGCFKWVINYLDKIKDAISDLNKNAMTHVTYAVCSEKRHTCPCVEDIRDIKKELGK